MFCPVIGSTFCPEINSAVCPVIVSHHHHYHQSLNREGRWGTTDNFATSFLNLFLFSTALWDLANCPFPDVVCPLLPLSALSSSPFHCALQGGFGLT